jgi:hypothetical protein
LLVITAVKRFIVGAPQAIFRTENKLDVGAFGGYRPARFIQNKKMKSVAERSSFLEAIGHAIFLYSLDFSNCFQKKISKILNVFIKKYESTLFD